MNREVRYQPSSESLPIVNWRTPTAEEMPSWRDAKRVAIDVETRDPDLKPLGPGVRRKGTYVCGVSFAIEDGPAHYIPIKHDGGDNVNWDIWAYLRDQIRDFRGTIVGNGIGYDLDWFVQNGCEAIYDREIMDIQVADVLIDENQFSYNLNSICERHGLPMKDEAMLQQVAAAYRIAKADIKENLWRFPGRHVAAYGIADVRLPLQALRRQEIAMEVEDVMNIWKIERQVTPILIKMRRRGVRVDTAKMDMIEAKCLAIETEEMAKVSHATGYKLTPADVWKSEALGKALKQIGYKLEKTAKGKDSVDKDALKHAGEVGAWILRAREWNKLRTTFVKQVRDHIIWTNGEARVHCTFNQLRADRSEDAKDGGKGVRYGRLSSTDFNVQQQPVRHDEYGALWRSVFVADHDARWACSDWSQQEPRIGVHYAEIIERNSQGRKCPGAGKFADEYRRNPRLDIHQKLADISQWPRKIVKNFVNGRLYGMGDVKLCWQLDWPTEMKTINVRGIMKTIEVPTAESKRKIDEFNSFAPWIRGLTAEAAKAAEKRGYVKTSSGRKCRFEKGPDGRIWKAHKAFNRIGQGEASDQMKLTLIEADREGIPIQMSVHDEFDFSFTDIKQPRRLKELQMTVKTYSVPMQCDLEIGPSWGELEKDCV